MHIPCLKDIELEFKRRINHMSAEVEMYTFPQTRTVLTTKNNGVNENIITKEHLMAVKSYIASVEVKSYTTVAIDHCSGYCAVFLGNEMAYILDNPNQYFFEDMHRFNMISVLDKDGKYDKTNHIMGILMLIYAKLK